MFAACRFAARIAVTTVILVSFSKAAAPVYSAASLVNTATGVAGEFAPNSMLTIYGTNLCYNTQAAAGGSGTMPLALGGVSVIVGGIIANLFYVSPQQVNVLIPANLVPGNANLYLVREGIAGPVLPIAIKETAPGFFQLGEATVIATHADGQLIRDDSPAMAEEVVVIYAAGLGRTVPEAEAGRAATRAAPIARLKEMVVLLDGMAVPPARILYAGITPGFPGLYQINLRVPGGGQGNPEIRVFIGPQGSPSYLKLPVRIQ